MSVAAGWRFDWDSGRAVDVLQIPWRALCPVPALAVHFWNTNVLDARPDLQSLGGIVLLCAAFAFLWPSVPAMFSFGIGVAGQTAFGYAKLFGVARHHGHLWLLFIACVWLGGGIDTTATRGVWRSWSLTALLSLHVACCAFASWQGLRHPFSNGAATAALIRAKGLQSLALLGYREPPASSVALALGQPLYAP